MPDIHQRDSKIRPVLPEGRKCHVGLVNLKAQLPEPVSHKEELKRCRNHIIVKYVHSTSHKIAGKDAYVVTCKWFFKKWSTNWVIFKAVPLRVSCWRQLKWQMILFPYRPVCYIYRRVCKSIKGSLTLMRIIILHLREFCYLCSFVASFLFCLCFFIRRIKYFIDWI